MKVGALHELEPAAEWRAGDVADPETWTLRLSAADHAELNAALAVAKDKSSDPLALERDDFPLDRLASKLGDVVDTLLNGRGFVRIAALDTGRATAMTTSRSSTGASACTSASRGPRTSTATSSVTSPIRARRSTTRRCAATSSAGLRSTTTQTAPIWSACSACARPVPVVSPAWPTPWRSTTTWCGERPDLAAALYEPLPYDTRGEQANGARAFYSVPAFTEHAGRLFVRFIPQYILASQRHPDTPVAQRDGTGGYCRRVRAGQ